RPLERHPRAARRQLDGRIVDRLPRWDGFHGWLTHLLASAARNLATRRPAAPLDLRSASRNVRHPVTRVPCHPERAERVEGSAPEVSHREHGGHGDDLGTLGSPEDFTRSTRRIAEARGERL